MKILIIDCDGVAWSVFHTMPALKHDEQDTGVIFGFLNHVFGLQMREQADVIVFAWDSRKSLRKKLFPEYKIKRSQKREEYTPEEVELHKSRMKQFKLLRKEVLPALGFTNVFHASGYEGDDIMASVVKSYKRGNFIKMIARDGDLYQLIDSNVSMFDWVKQHNMTDEAFFEEYGIWPNMWAEVKSIAGCTTDEVPGIRGIGYDRAAQYLLGKMKITSVLRQRIENNPDTIKFTTKLVVLPFKDTPTFKIKADTCKINKLKRVARTYGLRSFVTDGRLRDYRELFCERASHNTKKSKN